MEVPSKEELDVIKCRCKCGGEFKDGGYFSGRVFKHFFSSFECIKKWNTEKRTSHVPTFKAEDYKLTGPFTKNDRVKMGWK